MMRYALPRSGDGRRYSLRWRPSVSRPPAERAPRPRTRRAAAPPRPRRGRSAAAATGHARRAGRAQGRVRPAPGAHPGGLDDVGVGRRAGRPAGGVDARRRAARVAARRGRGRAAHPGRRARPPRPSCSTGSPSRTALPSTAPRSTSPRATGSRPTPTRRARRPARAVVVDGLPDAKSAELGRPVRARAQERRRRSGPRALLLDRVERQHLRRRPRRHAAARLDHADPAGRRPAGGLRPRGAQRHRARGRARRLGLDGGEQPRQHRVPVRRALRRTRGSRRRAR